MKKSVHIIIDLAISLALIFLDQFTKLLAVKHLKGRPAIPLISGVFELDYLENRGSAFGMFQNQKFFILLVSFVFLAVLLFLLFKLPEGKKYNWLHFVIVVIIAGGIGNMIDRFRLEYVVDFFSFVLIHFPVFNVADIYIVVATVLLAVLILFVYGDEDFHFLPFGRKKTGEKK